MLKSRDLLVALFSVAATLGIVGATAQTPVMHSTVFDWNSIAVKQTDIGSVRQFFKNPTITLDELECHVTTLNPGQQSHPPHKHPNEELIIIREGNVETLSNGELEKARSWFGHLQRVKRTSRVEKRRYYSSDLSRNQLEIPW